MLALIAAKRRRRQQRGKRLGVTAQKAGDRGAGALGGAGDLEAGQLAAAQCQDAGDAKGVGGSGGTCGARGAIVEPGVALGAEAGEPLVSAALRDAKIGGDLGDWLGEAKDALDHLGSTERGEFGLTVALHAAVLAGGWSHNPTSPSPRRMNNLLERHSYSFI